MHETSRLLQIVLPVFFVIGAGNAMRRTRILTEQVLRSRSDRNAVADRIRRVENDFLPL